MTATLPLPAAATDLQCVHGREALVERRDRHRGGAGGTPRVVVVDDELLLPQAAASRPPASRMGTSARPLVIRMVFPQSDRVDPATRQRCPIGHRLRPTGFPAVNVPKGPARSGHGFLRNHRSEAIRLPRGEYMFVILSAAGIRDRIPHRPMHHMMRIPRVREPGGTQRSRTASGRGGSIGWSVTPRSREP